MDAAFAIAGLWIAFAATHMGLSSLRWRPRLVAALGRLGFLGLYSLVALAIFVPMVSIYFANQHAGPHLWYLGYWTPVRWGVYLGMALALSLVVGGLIQPSPASMTGGRAEARGMLRITRHPLIMGFGVFGLLHLLAANVNASELAFFAGFPIFAVIGCRHQDQRKLVIQGEPYRRFCAETSLLPFGRGGLPQALRESYGIVAVAVGLAVALRAVHPSWFGGAP